jgi:hypothetical protein
MQHWQQTDGGRPGSMAGNPPNPYLVRETAAPPPAGRRGPSAGWKRI